MSRLRKVAAPQLQMWACPRCGQTYTLEDTGERVVDRRYGQKVERRLVRFLHPVLGDVTRCAGHDPQHGDRRMGGRCNRPLHQLLNAGGGWGR